MFFAQLRLPPNDLAGQMNAMRHWLDSHHVESAGFSYKENPRYATAIVGFSSNLDARAFSAHFLGYAGLGPLINTTARRVLDHQRLSLNVPRKHTSGPLSALRSVGHGAERPFAALPPPVESGQDNRHRDVTHKP